MDMTNKTNTMQFVEFVICFIMGTFNKISSMTMSDIKKHSYRLGVEQYEKFYGETLHKDLVEQFHVSGFPGMLLLKYARKVGCG